jgi:ABC-type metal ion transport system substrate-binding protein
MRVVYGDLRVETVRVTDWNHSQRDVPLDAQTFQPPPPLPDKPAQEELVLQMAAPTEETFIEGLRAYAAQSERLEALLAKKRAEIGEDPEDLERLQTMRDLLHLNSVYPTQLDLASLSIASLA